MLTRKLALTLVIAALAVAAPSPAGAQTNVGNPPGSGDAYGGVGRQDRQVWIGNGFGQPFRAQGGVLNAGPALAVARTTGQQLVTIEVATGTDNALWVRRETADATNGAWSRLSNDPTYCIGPPGAVVYLDTAGVQRLTVACRGSDNALWYATGAITGDQNPILNSWKSLGGVLEAGPAVGVALGSLIFAVTGRSGRIWLNWTLEAGNANFGATPWTCRGRPAIGSRPFSRLETATGVAYFGCHGTDDALWISRNRGQGWEGAASLGGKLREGVGVAVSADQAVFVVRGTDDAIYQTTAYNGSFPPKPFSANRPSSITYDPAAVALG